MQDGRIVEEGPPFDVLNDEARWERVRAAGVNVPQLFLLAHELRKKVEDGGRLNSLDPTEFPPQFTKALAIAMKGSRPGSAISLDPPSKPTGDPIVRVEHLWHVYEGGTVALRDASLAVHPGEMIAIVGQNGSGKTTLLKHVNGLLRPTRGRVLVEGIDTSRSDPSALSRLAGLVFQHPDRQLFKLGLKDEVELGMKRLGLEPQERARRVADILKLVGLEHAATSASFGLSLGERKRLARLSPKEAEVAACSRPTSFRMSATRRARSWGSSPRRFMPSSTSSLRPNLKSCRSGCWKTRPASRLNALGSERLVSMPSTKTRPLVGRSNPFTCFRRVVFPDPFWPTIASISPGWTAKLASRSATVSPS